MLEQEIFGIPIWFAVTVPIFVVGISFVIATMFRSIVDAPYKHLLRHEEGRPQAEKEILSDFFIVEKNGQFKVKCNTFGMSPILSENTISDFSVFAQIHYGYKVQDIIKNALEMPTPPRSLVKNQWSQKIIDDAKNNRVIGGKLYDDYIEIYWGGDLENLVSGHISHQPRICFDERGLDSSRNLQLGITAIKYFSTKTGEEIIKPITNAVSSAWSINRGFK